VKVHGTDDHDHFIGQSIVSGRDGANTLPNGEVIISLEAMRSAYVSKNPAGLLAYYIHHEAHHFAELVGRGWDNYEAGESRTYGAGRDVADIFEIGPVIINDKKISFKDWLTLKIKEEDRIIAQAKADKNPNALHGLFPGPKESAENEMKLADFKTEEDKLVNKIAALKKTIADKNQVDNGLRAALRDIVVKACADPDSVTQEDLDALPLPADPNFVINNFPQGLGPFGKCPRGLYVSLGARWGHGERLDMNTIRSIVHPNQPVMAPKPFPIPLAAIEYDRLWADVKALAISACDDSPHLSGDGIGAVLTLHHSLTDPNYRGDYRAISWEAQGLTGCASWVYASLDQNIARDNFGSLLSG
jgi:hypothetical protein